MEPLFSNGIEILAYIIGAVVEIAVIIAVAKYLIHYAAKVFAEEFKKIRDK